MNSYDKKQSTNKNSVIPKLCFMRLGCRNCSL